MPKVSADHERQQRQKILRAAAVCFSQRGYHDTSVQEICKEAGLSKGGLYTYFKSKDEILAAVGTDSLLMGLEQAMTAGRSGTTTLDKLDRVGQVVIERLSSSDPHTFSLPRLLPEIFAAASKNPHLRALWAQGYDRWKIFLVELLREGQAAQQVKAGVDPHALAAILVAVFDGLGMQENLTRSKVHWPHIVQTLRQALGEGILTTSGLKAIPDTRVTPAAGVR